MHDGSQRSYHQRSHVRGGVFLPCTWLEESEGRLRESDLVLWPIKQRRHDIYFEGSVDGGVRRRSQESPSLPLSLERRGGGEGFQGAGDTMWKFFFFSCLSSFICFFLSFRVGFTPLVLQHSCISCIYTVRLCISYDEVRLSSVRGTHFFFWQMTGSIM